MPIDQIEHIDPVYKSVIKDELLQKMEGKLYREYERLKRINNLGLMSLIFPLARHSKFEHTKGLYHCCNVAITCGHFKGHELCMKITSLLYHIGHCPFVYNTERGILLSAYYEEAVLKELQSLVHGILESKLLECPKCKLLLKKNIYDVLNEDNLVHFFSAHRFLNEYDSIVTGILKRDFKIDDKQIESIRKEILTNLICTHSKGYKYLEELNMLDYVLRDTYYLGGGQLNISINFLFEGDFLDTATRKEEWKLIRSNHSYLEEKIYDKPEAHKNTLLFEKLLAQVFCSKKTFFLSEVFEIDDEKFEKFIKENAGGRTKRRLKEFFRMAPNFTKVTSMSLYDTRQIDLVKLEAKLADIQVKRKGLLVYPFQKGMLLGIDRLEPSPPFAFLAPDAYLELFQNKLKDLSVIFEVLMRSFNFVAYPFSNEPLLGFADFMLDRNTYFDNADTLKLIIQALMNIPQDKRVKYGEKLTQSRTFKKEVPVKFNRILLEGIHRTEERRLPFGLTYSLINLPPRVLRMSSTQSLLKEVCNQLRNRVKREGNSDLKGILFESYCLVSEALNISKHLENRLLLNGIVTKFNTGTENEYDIISIQKYKNDCKLYIVFYECSLNDKDLNRNEQKMRTAARRIYDSFPENVDIKGYFLLHDETKPDLIKEKHLGIHFYS